MKRRWWWTGVSLMALTGCAHPRGGGPVGATLRTAVPSEEGDERTPPHPALALGPSPSDCPTGDEHIDMTFLAPESCPFVRRAVSARLLEAPPAPGSMPARADVTAAMRALWPSIRACGNDQPWRVVEVSFFFVSDGSVARVRLWRGFEAIPLGECVTAVARTARLPPFQRTTFAVTFPFALGPR